ncbi:hypothetical protein A2V80_02670 [Candidatus Woesebacteria bacterium RBG_16_39_8b]|uniref:Glycosidase n=1 Tax=Candidatus Woesebacteria bacterium RBG_16_39_8b TaxID=1802482 RepID=A0A1F7XA65_9BACT|nr:MAG: hypothetical protein A2V80_02670 [Candidatus Woesebacteria bacterium RBG_16_39_8b]
MIKLTRFDKNPIVKPIQKHQWEAKATFNPAAIKLNDKIHIVYRAMSEDNTSTLGYGVTSDGFNLDYRSQEPIYVPRESFEQKSEGNRFSGCEDPRLTQIDEKIYMCYTAYDGKNVPRVAFSTINVKDFLDWNWKWSKPVLISPPDFDDKDAFIFPEKVKGKYLVIHRSGVDMDYAYMNDLNFDGSVWLEENRWISPRIGWWDSRKIGSAGPPLKTSEGWIQLYHGVSDSNIYRVGAILLDLEDPTKVIGRTEGPIFEPEKDYEVRGEVANVVFPCGAVQLGRDLFVYYGAADKVLGVATCNIDELVRILKLCKV